MKPADRKSLLDLAYDYRCAEADKRRDAVEALLAKVDSLIAQAVAEERARCQRAMDEWIRSGTMTC